jgi:sugar transferase (PEP-CTERM/EpsH1 system associated)
VRILFLTHRLPYAPNRGDRIRAYHLIRHLAQRHEVHIVSLVHDAEEVTHAADLEPVVASVRVARVQRLRNLATAVVALAGTTPLTHILLHSAEIRPILEGIMRSTPPDLVIAYCSGMAAHAIETPLRGTPFLLDLVDVDSQKWADLSRTSTWPKRWIYQREARCLGAFERTATAEAIATTVVSERERVALEQVAPSSRAIVVQNGVDLTAFSPPGRPSPMPRVVFCGVFNYEPNETGALWLAKEVWPLVTREMPSAELVLVGMDPTQAVLALGRSPSIRVTGSVPDVRPYLWDSAVAVAPLHVARGVQNKVLEAIAAGLPCVVTPQVMEGLPAAPREACAQGADSETFARAIVDLLRLSPDERRRVALRANLTELSWAAQLAAFASLVDTASATPVTGSPAP